MVSGAQCYLALRDNPMAVARLKAPMVQILRRQETVENYHVTVFLVSSQVLVPQEGGGSLRSGDFPPRHCPCRCTVHATG